MSQPLECRGKEMMMQLGEQCMHVMVREVTTLRITPLKKTMLGAQRQCNVATSQRAPTTLQPTLDKRAPSCLLTVRRAE